MENRSDFDEAFIRLGNKLSYVAEADMNGIENFAMKMYTKLSNISLTDLRIDMLKSLTDNDLRKLGPSRRAPKQHTKRACYQFGYVWQESVSDIALPNPENWGWVFEGNMYQPRWPQENCSIKIETLICSCHKGTCKKILGESLLSLLPPPHPPPPHGKFHRSNSPLVSSSLANPPLVSSSLANPPRRIPNPNPNSPGGNLPVGNSPHPVVNRIGLYFNVLCFL